MSLLRFVFLPIFLAASRVTSGRPTDIDFCPDQLEDGSSFLQTRSQSSSISALRSEQKLLKVNESLKLEVAFLKERFRNGLAEKSPTSSKRALSGTANLETCYSYPISGKSPGSELEGQSEEASSADCESRCSALSECQAFSYRHWGRVCKVLDRVYNMNYEVANDGTVVVNKQSCALTEQEKIRIDEGMMCKYALDMIGMQIQILTQHLSFGATADSTRPFWDGYLPVQAEMAGEECVRNDGENGQVCPDQLEDGPSFLQARSQSSSSSELRSEQKLLRVNESLKLAIASLKERSHIGVAEKSPTSSKRVLSSTPKSEICYSVPISGQFHRVRKSRLEVHSIEASYADCESRCSALSECQAVIYHPSSGRCNVLEISYHIKYQVAEDDAIVSNKQSCALTEQEKIWMGEGCCKYAVKLLGNEIEHLRTEFSKGLSVDALRQTWQVALPARFEYAVEQCGKSWGI